MTLGKPMGRELATWRRECHPSWSHEGLMPTPMQEPSLALSAALWDKYGYAWHRVVA